MNTRCGPIRSPARFPTRSGIFIQSLRKCISPSLQQWIEVRGEVSLTHTLGLIVRKWCSLKCERKNSGISNFCSFFYFRLPYSPILLSPYYLPPPLSLSRCPDSVITMSCQCNTVLIALISQSSRVDTDCVVSCDVLWITLTFVVWLHPRCEGGAAMTQCHCYQFIMYGKGYDYTWESIVFLSLGCNLAHHA